MDPLDAIFVYGPPPEVRKLDEEYLTLPTIVRRLMNEGFAKSMNNTYLRLLSWCEQHPDQCLIHPHSKPKYYARYSRIKEVWLEYAEGKRKRREARLAKLADARADGKLNRFSALDIKAIKQAIAFGETRTSVAIRYGVSLSMISRINNGQRYRKS